MFLDSNKINCKISLGAYGEKLVANKLLKDGFFINERNYRKKFGEIDLIASKGNLIIFIEVKLRKSVYFNISEVIVTSKKKKIILTAKEYIIRNKYLDKIFRFDVALIEYNEHDFKIKYIENAFTESD